MKRVHTKYIHHVQHFSLLFLPLFSFILRIWCGFFARSLSFYLPILSFFFSLISSCSVLRHVFSHKNCVVSSFRVNTMCWTSNYILSLTTAKAIQVLFIIFFVVVGYFGCHTQRIDLFCVYNVQCTYVCMFLLNPVWAEWTNVRESNRAREKER